MTIRLDIINQQFLYYTTHYRTITLYIYYFIIPSHIITNGKILFTDILINCTMATMVYIWNNYV